MHKVMAMMKQLGIRTFFMSLSSAGLRWNELIYVISKLSAMNISEYEINKLTYQERCKILITILFLLYGTFSIGLKFFLRKLFLMSHWQRPGTIKFMLNYK